MEWRSLVILATAACGRVGFDRPSSDAVVVADGDTTDSDATAVCPGLFCDGFEDPGLAVWTLQAGAPSTAVRDAAFGFRGASLHATSPPNTFEAAASVDVFAPGATIDQWARVYIYAPSGMQLNNEPVEFTNPTVTRSIVFSLYDTGVDIHAHNLANEFSTTALVAPPRDRWVCYELHVHIAAVGTVELFRDDVLIVAEPNLDTRPPGDDLSRVRVGILSKPDPLDENLFIDEVAAGTSQIGCD